MNGIPSVVHHLLVVGNFVSGGEGGLRRILVRTVVQTSDVVWLLSVDLVGTGTPMLVNLTGRERRLWRLGGMVAGAVSPRRASRKTVQMAISIVV